MKTKSLIQSLIGILVLTLLLGFKADNKKNDLPKYISIPAGSTSIENSVVSFDSYWISAYEVSNKEYNTFLDDLKGQGKTDGYEIARIRNEQWMEEGSYNDPYAEYYHTHQAYELYPVVNISHEGAKLYCKWLTEKSEEEDIEYRLPTKKEWIYAAKGGFDESFYPWGGNFLQDKKGRDRCNYSKIGDELIHYDNETKTFEVIQRIGVAAITAPVVSYWPNEYGIHNASGNVAEMVSEDGIAMGGSWNSTGYDVRILSVMDYSGPSQHIGFRPMKFTK